MFPNHLPLFLLLIDFNPLVYESLELSIILYIQILLISALLFVSAHPNLIFVPFLFLYWSVVYN